jgi:hypothetical protein
MQEDTWLDANLRTDATVPMPQVRIAAREEAEPVDLPWIPHVGTAGLHETRRRHHLNARQVQQQRAGLAELVRSRWRRCRDGEAIVSPDL